MEENDEAQMMSCSTSLQDEGERQLGTVAYLILTLS